LNEHCVSQSFAITECCAYKAAVTERRVYPSVRKIACQAKARWTGSNIHIAARRLTNCDNVAICLGGDSKCLRKEVAGEGCCSAAMGAKAVIDRAVTVVAHYQEARSGLRKCQVRSGHKGAGRDDLDAICCRVSCNDKSAYAVKRKARGLSVDTEPGNQTAIGRVEGGNVPGADQDLAIGQNRDGFAADTAQSWGYATRAES